MKKIINGYESHKPVDVQKYAKSDVNGWSWVERWQKQTWVNVVVKVLCWPWEIISTMKLKRGKK
jgi:hypothetical protein